MSSKVTQADLQAWKCLSLTQRRAKERLWIVEDEEEEGKRRKEGIYIYIEGRRKQIDIETPWGIHVTYAPVC